LGGFGPEAFFAGLVDTLKRSLVAWTAGGSAQAAQPDSPNALPAILSEIVYDPSAAPAGPLRESDTHYVADSPVETLLEDRLGVAAEARALAEVICLREPAPPSRSDCSATGDRGSRRS
jgi:hypothetical protein